jgi:hypothetical protein
MSVELSSYRDQHFKGSRSEQERLLQKVSRDWGSGSAWIRIGLGRLDADPDPCSGGLKLPRKQKYKKGRSLFL